MDTQIKNFLKFLIFPLALLLVVVFVADAQIHPDYLLHINFYDVGQGDAVFIQTYQGNQIVLDGGPSDKILSLLGKDMPFFDRTIELMIMSHPHEDHIIGLIDILKRFEVKKILLPEVDFNSTAFLEFIRLIDEKQVEKIYAYEGERIWLDNATVLDIYYPPPGAMKADNNPSKSKGEIEPNDASIVGKLSFGKSRILFTGDAGADIENKIIPKYNLDADILKVGHQGSRFSTSEEFLQEVTPQFAVIMVGKNNYGHPTQEVLDKLAAANAQILRTDLDHTIRFTFDGFFAKLVRN
ncbi:MAG: hypothetical protein A3B10_01910 [Candidatus Doudnabacteria bacterium RIFCSPLOWO2_01_FULL_44_21]|uniref:Metallo-beta-lactamase domain-containing protein n=1 Tax=Candidatus Doudnabacteria bacterium RIFCSPLOWO2_01_FULL_44_21 TaxID=1817841 RepID=A0A1F5Q2L5_9BACT|nr:MAG: hypothetical protein A3B95_01795 [Candidatus Doudnabacteria bacterium RIFCSPHIGHO2_02_FULL_43_13b]OGE96419.1 MAG: hypothetical protein A3B10_01910 [Candidatus Doudnabacteria bacterium RIFCSPLOWO2_01_FULL_44_21]